jgi:hypothetical protein
MSNSAVDVSNPELKESWAELTDQKGDLNWLVWGFENGSKTKLTVIGKGSGGLNELIPHLDPSKVLFAGLKVIGVDAQPNLTSSRNKFVFITWSGSKVNAITKAKVSIQQQVVYALCNGVTANVQASDADDLTPKHIGGILIRSGGAHKPTHYDFGGDVSISIGEL